jgi:DNA-binding IclR family transcriptional regulator
MTDPDGVTARLGQDDTYAVQALDRAFRILELLGERPLRAAEIGLRLGLHRSTVFRLLSNLERWGYVRRNPADGSHALGLRLFELGSRAVQDEIPVYRLRGGLADLAETTGHTAQLWIRSGREAVCLDQVEPQRDVRVTGQIGRRLPLNCGAVSKVLLAFAPLAQREQFLARPLPRLSPGSVTDPAALRTELARIRVEGCAITDGELRASSKAVAAPVFNAAGEVVLAVCILALAAEIDAGNIAEVTAAVVEAGRRLSAELGYRAGPAIPVPV